MNIKIQFLIQDLIYTKAFHWFVFKRFELPNDMPYCYYAIRYKWMVRPLRYLTGCKHRWWVEAQLHMAIHDAELRVEEGLTHNSNLWE